MRKTPLPKYKPGMRLDRVTTTILVIAIILGGVGGFFLFRLIYSLALTWNVTQLPGAPVDSGQVAAGTPSANSTPGAAQLSPPISQAPAGIIEKPWDGASRVNVLVMGLDYRDWEAGEIPRSDTMILFTIDPISKTAGMLSIPRDMWVNIPDFDFARINTAFYLGEANKLPGGGPAMAAKTVEHFLGVPVDYYAQIDFSAFEKFIDEIGGIVIHPKQAITIYPMGKPKVTLEPGGYHVGGDYALAYARQRYTEFGDFDRSARQQEVIMAIRWQIMSKDMLPVLIQKAPILYQELASGIHTNLTLDQVIQLALLSAQVEWENIKKGAIGPQDCINSVTPDNQKILVPIHDKIRLIRDEIFTSGGPVGPAAVADNPMLLIQQEQARVSLQNGSSQPGIANRAAGYFRQQGVNVVEEINADQVYSSSQLIIYNGKPYTANYFANLMKIPVSNTINRFDPTSQIDLAVIIGEDWANSNPMP